MEKKKLRIIVISVILVNVILFIIGICINNTKFWEISLNGILSLDFTALLSVFFVQLLIGKRRKNDFLVKLLDNIIKELGDENLLNHNERFKAPILQKSIANKLLHLSKACPSHFLEDMNYIKEKFEEIQTYYGDHQEAQPEDPYYERVKTDIVNKIVKLQLELHDFIMK